MDLYLFNTIINSAWYLFTIMFVLYRFTTFFSHAYSFFKFCGKVVSGGKYVVGLCFNYFKQKQIIETTNVIDETENLHNDTNIYNETPTTESFIDKIKKQTSSLYYMTYHKIFGKYHPSSTQNYVELPLYKSTNETNSSNDTYVFKDVINSFSKNQNYSSLFETNKTYSSNSNMLHTIDLNESKVFNNINTKKANNKLKILLENETPKIKPFGIDNSALLFNSSFINSKIKNNLPFAMNSFMSTSLHPLHENEKEYFTENDIKEYKEYKEYTYDQEESEHNSEESNNSEENELIESKYQECE